MAFPIGKSMSGCCQRILIILLQAKLVVDLKISGESGVGFSDWVSGISGERAV